jgi:hypothetical protein
MSEKRKLVVTIHGYGGEHTIGTLSAEQAEYWLDQGEDALSDHVWDEFAETECAEDEVIGAWSDVDDVDHTYGASYNRAVRIKFGNDEEREYSEHDSTFQDLPMDGNFEIYSDDLAKETPYLICFSEEKGQLYWGEIEIEDDAVFNIDDIELITKDIFGTRFVVDVTYKGVLLENNGSDAIGKGFQCKIEYPEDILD